MSGIAGYTENDLDGLTPEEIEALKEDDGANDNTTLGESLNEDGTLKTGEESANSGTSDDDAAAAAAAAAAANTGKTDDAAAAAKVDDAATKVEQPAQRPQPILVAEMPENVTEKLAEIGSKKADLLDQFDNGDITAKEYQSQLDVLNKDERTIENAVEKAKTAQEMNQQQERNSWLGQVQDFTNKAHPEYASSRSRWMALDTFVKEIANDPANAQLTGTQILAKAHEMVEKDLGVAPATAKKDPPKLDDKAGKPLKGAKIDPPQTLRNVPAASQNDIEDNSKFAALDRLAAEDPLALEEKLMKMSADDRDAYLASR